VRTGDIEKKAVIIGTVSGDGRITATATGASKYLKPEPQDKPGQWVNTEKMGWLLISGLATFEFHGTFEGKIAQGRASGSFTADRSDKPPSDKTRIAGTWQASHQ
jgi:hypothetical protein